MRDFDYYVWFDVWSDTNIIYYKKSPWTLPLILLLKITESVILELGIIHLIDHD